MQGGGEQTAGAASADSGRTKCRFGALQLAVAGVLTVLSLFYFYGYIHAYWQYPLDDAFIHFRIARNFAETGRPYYNPDQAVAGSSSLFWTFLIGLLFALLGTKLTAVAVVTFVFTGAVLLLLVALLSNRFAPWASAGVAFVIVTVFLLNVSAELMETPAALTFFLGALLCWRARRFAWLGFFSAMAFATRYEFALWIALGLALSEGMQGKRRYLMGAALPLVVLVLADFHFFGTVLPNTVFAKGKVYQLAFSAFFGQLEMHLPEAAAFVLASAIMLQSAAKRDTPAWALAATLFPLVLFGLYWLARTILFEWYLPLVLVPLVLAPFLVLPTRRLAVVLFLLAIALRPFAIRSALEAYGVFSHDPRLYRDYATGARVRQYTFIGTQLWQLFPDAALMTAEIGGLGWAFRGKVIDAVGLVSPECLRYHPMRVPEERSSGTLGAIPPQAVRDLTPKLVVSMDAFSEAFRRDLAAGKLPHYRLFKTYPVFNEVDALRGGLQELWSSRFTRVYVRD